MAFRRYFGACGGGLVFRVLWVCGMARSFRRVPVVKQERVDKRVWNRAIRNKRLDYSMRGSQYKKVMPNWNTWQYRWTLRDAIREYSPSERFPTLESWILYWKKCCLWK